MLVLGASASLRPSAGRRIYDQYGGWRFFAGLDAKLTAQLVATEEEINDSAYRLYGLSKADIAFLEEHAEHAVINYAYGEP